MQDAAKPRTFAVVKDGFTINTVVWDGVSDYDAGEGCTLVPIEDAPPSAPAIEEEATPES